MHHIMYDGPCCVHHVPSPSRPAAIENEDYTIDTAGTPTGCEYSPGYSDVHSVQGHKCSLRFYSNRSILYACQDSDDLWLRTRWFVFLRLLFSLATMACSLLTAVAFNTATDFYLATFPIYSFWSLQLRLRIKIVLLCLLSMGLLYVHRRIRANPTELFVFAMSLTQFASLYTSAMVACIIKTVQLHLIDRPGDPTIAQAQLLHWAYIEAGLVVITSSVPCLRPLFIAMAKNFSSSPRPTYELTPAFGQSHNHTRTHVTSRIHTYVRGDANDGWGDGDSAREILGETRGGITKETTVTVQNEELRA